MLALALATALPIPAKSGAAGSNGDAKPCITATPPHGPVTTAQPVTPDDLVRLADIGSPLDLPGEPAFSVSPNGQQAAFQLRRADPLLNRYCLQTVVVALRPGSPSRVIDSGGEFLRWHFANLLGKADFPTGFARANTPRWLMNGSAVFFLKQDDAGVQIWRAATDGSASQRITNGPDIADFRLSHDGRLLIYATQTGAKDAREALEREGMRGFHLDDRFSPVSASTPFAPGPLALSYRTLELGSGKVRPASDAERGTLAGKSATDGEDATLSGSGRRAWTQPHDATRFPPLARLVAEDEARKAHPCQDRACVGAIDALWWSQDEASIFFVRREGWGNERTAVYDWRVGAPVARRVLVTSDLLTACQPAGSEILCATEGSTAPRRLVAYRVDTGAARVVFDPNPKFAAFALGRVERLRWRAPDGTEVFGDLVHPVEYRPGHRYPLVVVQYESRGFLRGGTGDEYPIQALAGRGFAVLSYQQPEFAAPARGARSWADVDRAALRGFQVRRANLNAIEHLIRTVVARGLVDPARIGITGLSDGSSTVQFAGLHSRHFRAAAMSSCCWEETQDAVVGPSIARLYHRVGWPELRTPRRDFWRAISWLRRSRPIAFPVLMQLADREYLAALPTITAMQQRGDPVDAYVFPDEHHVKWQPAHRLAAYARALAWFDFWLQGRDSPDRAFTDELRRWHLLIRRRTRARMGG